MWHPGNFCIQWSHLKTYRNLVLHFCRERGLWIPREKDESILPDRAGKANKGTLGRESSVSTQPAMHPSWEGVVRTWGNSHIHPKLAQSEKGPEKWESERPELNHTAQQPQQHPTQLLQAMGVTQPSHLDSETIQAHLLSGSFGIIRSVTS